jgi:outer membrane protein
MRRLRSGLLLGFAACCVPLAARADGGAPLPSTLTQALVDAYENNSTLQEQRAALRQTDEDVPTALAGWRPTITVTGSAGPVRGSETTPTSVVNPETLQTEQVSEKLKENRTEEIGQVQLTQNIYNGGHTVALTREGKNSVYAARAQLLASEQTVFLNVINAYVTVITNQHVLALDDSDVDVLTQQLQATQDQFNVGEITLTSVAQAQASLAQAKEQVEVARGNLQISRENFRELVGEYPADILTPPQPLVLPVASKEAAANLSVANNPNVIAAKFTDAAAKDSVDVAYSALAPQLSVQASAFDEVNPSGPNSNLNGGQVLGELTVPIYQGGSEYSAIRLARAKEQQDFAAILDTQRTAYAQATQAWEGLIAARAAIVSTNAEIKSNAIALDGTEREEIVGTRTTLDVLNAQEALLQSQVQQVQNIATLVNDSYTVASAIGRLTATDLALPVDQYDDLKYYKAVEYAGFGTGESADRKAGILPNGTLETGDAPLPPAPALQAGAISDAANVKATPSQN